MKYRIYVSEDIYNEADLMNEIRKKIVRNCQGLSDGLRMHIRRDEQECIAQVMRKNMDCGQLRFKGYIYI